MSSMETQAPYSADVRLDLLVDGRVIPVAKAGPNYAILREGTEIPAGAAAELVMIVDGREHRWEVILVDGAVPFDEKVSYRVQRYPLQHSLFNPRLH